MTDFAIIVDKQTGFKTQESPVIVLEDGEYLYYELKDNELAIPIDNNIGDVTINMNKPQWQFDTKEWIDTDPLPPVEPEPQEPSKMEVLKARVDGLENINAGLLLENAGHQIKIQEQEKMNKEQEVTNANLLLEIAMLKGAML